MNYYDIHCHVFNKDVIIRRLVNVVQSLLSVKELLDSEISAEELKYKIEGINKTLQEVTQDSSEDVFKTLDKVYQGKVVATPLMFDLSYADDNDDNEHKNKRYRNRIKLIFILLSTVLIPFIRGRIKRKMKNDELVKVMDKIQHQVVEFNKSFMKKPDKDVEIFDHANYDQQISDLEYLAGKYKTILPFFSVDPRREYKGGINMLKKVKEKLLSPGARFAGIKLYAPAGFSPTDPVLMGNTNDKGIYAICQENNIPITVHNSNAGFACLSSVLKVRGQVFLNGNIFLPEKPIKFRYNFFSPRAGDAIKERAKILNHPCLWKIVLEKYPKLTINFAHFGGSGQIMDYVNYIIPVKSLDADIFEHGILHCRKKLNTESVRDLKKKAKK
jgi:predicted TIM-barrel fold metal-dependent hydrolase